MKFISFLIMFFLLSSIPTFLWWLGSPDGFMTRSWGAVIWLLTTLLWGLISFLFSLGYHAALRK